MAELRDSRLQEIDLLRFLSALAVVFFHYTFVAAGTGLTPVAEWPAVSSLSRYGYLGVTLFFIISGFVILLSAQGRTPSQFVRSRFLRLFPAYWLGLTVTALVLALWGAGRHTVSLPQYLANLFMLQKVFGYKHVDGVYWTLLVELKFYFLVWLLLRFDQLKKLRGWVWGWLSCAALALLVPEKVGDRMASLLLADTAPYFIIGIAAFLIRQDGGQRRDWALMVAAGWIAGVVAAHEAVELSIGYRQTISATVVVCFVALFCLLFAAIARDYGRPLRRSWLTPIGALTYPLYLLHAYIGFTVMRLLGGSEPNPVFILSLIAVMLLAAWVLHRYGEQPLTRWMRQRLQTRNDSNSAA